MGGTGRSLPLLLLFVVVLLQQHMRTTTALGRFTSNIINSYCIESERRALLTFKYSLVDDFSLLSSWGTELEAKRDCCRWWGIQCSNQTGHVIMLNLRRTYDNGIGYGRLRGNISPSLLELQHLTHLDLSHNDFGGSRIPEFIGSLSKLRYLGLSWANFSGTLPYQLGNLSSLRFLDLSYNFYTNAGNLEWLPRLSSLKHLNLTYIDLSKTNHWMQAIKMLPSLTELRLSECKLSEALRQTLYSSLPFINSSASLVVLDLSFNNLTSSMFYWLFNLNLSSLVDLDLSSNQLQGPIPDAFGNIVSLENLYLGYNQLEGGIPKSFGNMCNLRTLSLYRNNFTGQLSEFVQNFSSGCLKDTLGYLNLHSNQIWGSLPDLTVFSSLRALYLSNNQLNGTVHKGIGNLSKLESLDVSSNSLEGVISEAHLLNLSKLQYLDISFNSLALNFNSDWIPPFQLNYIQLSSCKMGPRFPEWLQTQKNFSFLDISNAGISDAIPNWFWDLPYELKFLNLSHNLINGIVPDLSLKFAHYIGIDLSSNHFEGPIPQLPPNMSSLNLSNNKFLGSISFLCEIGGNILSYLDLSDNLLSGELPDCWMHLENLVILNLANNNLSGKIPNSMGYLFQIETLVLRNNRLSGELPSSLKNCTELKFMDVGENRLSGKIPAWIGESLSNLVILSLQSNEFYGRIPSHLCHLSHVQIFDISQNNISGTIPKCLDNLTALAERGISSATISHSYAYSRIDSNSYNPAYYVDYALLVWKGKESEYRKTLGLVKIIDFSSNKLTGEIPGEIGILVGLVALNLSRNSLTGLITSTIGQLKALDFLDLSRNKLFGGIPASFSQINGLSVLDLSYNNLSGKIPTSTQLQSFNTSAYMGNTELCGAPLPNKCPGDEATQDPLIVGGNGDTDIHGDEDGFITPGFYVSMGLGFSLGFWGVCGTLLFNDSWRYAYFKFLNNIRDRLYVAAAVKLARLQRRLQS